MAPTLTLLLVVLAVLLFGLAAALPVVPYDPIRLRLVGAGLMCYALATLLGGK